MILGPIAVLPEHRRRGIGTALINEGLERAAEVGFGAVVVVGDPVYYSRFGFVPAKTKKLRTTFKLPDENLMVKEISRNALRWIIGTVIFPREYLTLAEADRERKEESAVPMAIDVLTGNSSGIPETENDITQIAPAEIAPAEIAPAEIAPSEIKQVDTNPNQPANNNPRAEANPEKDSGGNATPPENNILM